jgi:tetratricopeptide (TPR) repeat protein
VRAQARLKLGQYTEARVDCEAVLLEDALSLKALYRGALACHKLHDYDVAMGYLLRAAALAPTVRPRPPSQQMFQNRLPEI